MKIELEGLGKKYLHEWVFKNLNTTLSSGNSYAITGPNGSGKSTLIQVIAGALLPSSGNISYDIGAHIPNEEIYQHISIATPYLEMIEEFTLIEFLNFHFKFKKLAPKMNVDKLISASYLDNAKNKYIKNFSSGMKQRLKLALCFFSDSEILLFDEPTSNLDQKGIEWYQYHVNSISKDTLTVIASNQKDEYAHCNSIININDYK
jgi:ABC-type multidrug transport system ATPase subunit